MAQSFFGGIHPRGKKSATNKNPIEMLPLPEYAVIPMALHIGAPCRPCVKVGERVKVGQLIGEPTGFVAAPIHASMSGTVVAVEPRPQSGGEVLCVVIENDGEDTIHEDIRPAEHPDSLTTEQLLEIIKKAGIVGMGGAYPTHAKIAEAIGKVDTVIINAAESEPYVTSDHRILLEYPDEVLGGTKLLARMFRVDKVHIGTNQVCFLTENFSVLTLFKLYFLHRNFTCKSLYVIGNKL